MVAAVEEAPGSMVDEMEHTPDPALIDKTWAWERRDPNGNDIPAITISNPENHTLFFNEDGTFNVKADCNVGRWTLRYYPTRPHLYGSRDHDHGLLWRNIQRPGHAANVWPRPKLQL
ncbi:MAG: hypothetical protein HC804_04810 [Anaerolineae bacterium]|nr:hypothetical protein [Anaerolineae bacterium]